MIKYDIYLIYNFFVEIDLIQMKYSFNMYFMCVCVCVYIYIYNRDGSRLSNIRIFYLIIEYRLSCAIIF